MTAFRHQNFSHSEPQEEEESDSDHYSNQGYPSNVERQYSQNVRDRKGSVRSHHSSLVNTPQNNPLSMYGASKIAALRNLNLSEHKKVRGLTFKTVCKSVIGFIRQEKILRTAIGPVKLNQPHKFDLKRLKAYVKRTRAFSAGLSKTKQIEIKAPGAEKKKQAGVNTLKSAVGQMNIVKKLSTKKGGFVKPSDDVEQAEQRSRPQSEFVQDERQLPGYPPTGYGQEMDRRFPPEYGPPGHYDRPPPPGWEQYDRYGPPPRDWHPRDEYEYYHGYSQYRNQRPYGPRDDYYRRMDHEWGGDQREQGCEDEGQDQQNNMEDYRREVDRTPHGERYKLAPPGYGRSRNYGRSTDRSRRHSPGEDRYLKLFDSSPEDQRRGHSTRDDLGYYSGPMEIRDDKAVEIEEEMPDRREASSRYQKEARPKHRQPNDRKNRSSRREQHRSLSPTPRDKRTDREIPEEYKWAQKSRSPRRTSILPSKSFDHGYHNARQGYPRYPNAREEMAKLQSMAVYATAMGGLNSEDEGL